MGPRVREFKSPGGQVFQFRDREGENVQTGKFFSFFFAVILGRTVVGIPRGNRPYLSRT
jgi:hypothetical protein